VQCKQNKNSHCLTNNFFILSICFCQNTICSMSDKQQHARIATVKLATAAVGKYRISSPGTYRQLERSSAYGGYTVVVFTSAIKRLCNRRCLCVCLSVCLIATLRKNFLTVLHVIFREGCQWVSEQLIKFLWRSVSLFGDRDCFRDSYFVTVGIYGK